MIIQSIKIIGMSFFLLALIPFFPAILVLSVGLLLVTKYDNPPMYDIEIIWASLGITALTFLSVLFTVHYWIPWISYFVLSIL